MKKRQITLLVTLAGCASCSSGAEEPAPPPTAVAPSDAATNRIEIPAVVRANLGITFAPVEARRVAQTLRVPGAFELRPRARREYRLALSGTVELLVDQYDAVEAGDVLYRLQSSAWQELVHEILDGEQAIDTARAEIEVANATLAEANALLEALRDRTSGLGEVGVKDAELDARVVELEASLPRLAAVQRLAESRLASAERARHHGLHRASTMAGIPEHELEEIVPGDTGTPVPKYLALEWMEVRAMDDGVVEIAAVTDGAFVESPGLVLSTVDATDVRFRALALQADLPRLARVSTARIVPPQTLDHAIESGIAATLSVGLEAHPDERTLSLLAMPLETADWVRHGVSAFLEVVTDETADVALAIPRSAVVQDGLEHVFFRRDPKAPNTVIRVTADLGISDGRWIEIRSGLMRGDEVVLDGVYELKLASGSSSEAEQGGHVHADGSVHDDH